MVPEPVRPSTAAAQSGEESRSEQKGLRGLSQGGRRVGRVRLMPSSAIRYMVGETGSRCGKDRMRLVWARNRNTPIGNLGDMASPIVVAALTGEPIRFTNIASVSTRLAAVGTIGHLLEFGKVHAWGTGFTGSDSGFGLPQRPPSRSLGRRFGRILVHAARGPMSTAIARAAGATVTGEIWGDPVWLLPSIWPAQTIPTHDLGVVLHLTEVENPAFAPKPMDYARYGVDPDFSSRVKIIHPMTARSVAAVRAKVEEILSCRRILSTSLHGLLIAEAYGIPCAAFDLHSGDSGLFDPWDAKHPLDHRMRDFHAGLGRARAVVVRRERGLATDWQAAMEQIDRDWRRAVYDSRPFLQAFPEIFGSVLERPIGSVAQLSRLVPLP